jgi:hypothetical protein
VGAIYYWILHYHPVAIVGYLVVMERSTPTLELIDELRSRSGFPPTAAFPTLAHHVAIDPDHGDVLWTLLDRLPLTPPQLEVISAAALHTLDLRVAALRELIAGDACSMPRQDGP